MFVGQSQNVNKELCEMTCSGGCPVLLPRVITSDDNEYLKRD